MSRFRIGDRVIATRSHPSGNTDIYKGDQGVVCYLPNGIMIGVNWDNKIANGHTCDNNCEKGHGWNVLPGEINFPPESEADFDIEESAFMGILKNV